MCSISDSLNPLLNDLPEKASAVHAASADFNMLAPVLHMSMMPRMSSVLETTSWWV